MRKIISADRSIIIALDAPFENAVNVVEHTNDLSSIGGYKIPHISGAVGWKTWVEYCRRHTGKPLIYDAQKWFPDPKERINIDFISNLKNYGIDAAIVFPLINLHMLEQIGEAAREKRLGLIVGGDMTTENNGSESALVESLATGVYHKATELGVRDFVIPGTKPDRITYCKMMIECSGLKDYSFFSPGFVTQGGKISNCAKRAGKYFHAIIGEGVYWDEKEKRFATKDEMRERITRFSKQINYKKTQ